MKPLRATFFCSRLDRTCRANLQASRDPTRFDKLTVVTDITYVRQTDAPHQSIGNILRLRQLNTDFLHTTNNTCFIWAMTFLFLLLLPLWKIGRSALQRLLSHRFFYFFAVLQLQSWLRQLYNHNNKFFIRSLNKIFNIVLLSFLSFINKNV